MRWSIVRLIWLRELRDQLRDRRTLFMIVGLPLLLYPTLGVIVLTFALQFFEKPSLIGLVVADDGEQRFPPRGSPYSQVGPAGAASLIAHGAAAEPTFWAAPLVRG